ncbi:MAG: hypothetical protein CMJ58_26545 [Planctomycetaceae bacterium]|nr:hypothetical protein [Planctomycetaceae bacterium]
MAAGDTLLEFDALANRPPATGFATVSLLGDWPVLVFADGETQAGQFAAFVPGAYRGGALIVAGVATADVTSGVAQLQLDLYRVADGDALGALPTPSATLTTSVSAPTTAGDAVTFAFSAGTMASLAAGDWLVVRVSRIGGDAGDTLAGAVDLLGVTVTEQ